MYLLPLSLISFMTVNLAFDQRPQFIRSCDVRTIKLEVYLFFLLVFKLPWVNMFLFAKLIWEHETPPTAGTTEWAASEAEQRKWRELYPQTRVSPYSHSFTVHILPGQVHAKTVGPDKPWPENCRLQSQPQIPMWSHDKSVTIK